MYKFINSKILKINKFYFSYFLNLGQILHGLNKLFIKSMMQVKYKKNIFLNF